MKASIITIGDEILIGQVVDTNSAWISQQLSFIGIDVKKIWSVSDQNEEIKLGIKQAVAESDIILITGGLGPTKDDITKKAIAEFLGVELFFHEETYDRITKIFARMGKTISVSHKDQCLMPTGVHIFKNSMGTAPGMLFRIGKKVIISMPGVPYEMKAIMNEEVLPFLKSSYETPTIIHKTILTSCVGETILEDQITDIVNLFPDHIHIAYLPAIAQVRLRISATGLDVEKLKKEVDYFSDQIETRLGDLVYGFGESNLESEIGRLCIEKGIKIGAAESCTGGLVSSKIVSIPGSSNYFSGSIVSYSNVLKAKLLNVKSETLNTFGAVSEETVKEMVDGAIITLNVDVAVAISGIAGPDGGTEEKPVGSIWICVGNKDHKITYLVKAGKDRNKNIEIGSVYALNQLRLFIKHL